MKMPKPLFWVSAALVLITGLAQSYVDDQKMQQAVSEEVAKQLKENGKEEKA